ncbi:hypothetical protein [Pseudonocardia spirodelae]|uniref:Uncharacterized protein n=1 Tax=Pseudonocardia spirodelae TaxID=3133431 RepID=A0ABU8TEF6_9PSEU
MPVAFVPAAVPALDLHDSGRWRELGVTHWHCGTDDVATDDKIRYSAERWHGLTGARYELHTGDPHEAWRFMAEARIRTCARGSDPAAVARAAGIGSPEEWERACRLSWWMLTHAKGFTSTGIVISDGRSVDLFVEGMTPYTCSRHP